MDQTLVQGLARLEAEDGLVREILARRFDETAALLLRYIEEIELFNPAYGLVGARDRRELVIKHILDSLSPLGCICRLLGDAGGAGNRGGGAIADAGSGAGLPGIPLAIALPDRAFTLIERMGRRIGFLRNTLAVLGLKNVQVEPGEMEKAPPGRFDLVCFRAFRHLSPEILRGLFRLLKPGGVLAAYKGRAAAVEAEMAGVSGPPLSWECLPCPVPFLDEERHLLLIRPR